jgi:hypothetical protein
MPVDNTAAQGMLTLSLDKSSMFMAPVRLYIFLVAEEGFGAPSQR